MADDLMDFLNKIQTQYPAAVPILTQPGVAAVFVQAVKEGWSPERLQAALEQTEWWKTTPAPVRASQALQATDPASYAMKVEQTKRLIDDISKQLGVSLDVNGGLASPGFAFLRDAVAYGWDANEIRYRLAQGVNQTNWGGEIATNAAKVKSMANDYGVPLSDQAVLGYGKQLTGGVIDEKGIQGYLIEQAKSLFPSLTAALDQGITVRQYVDPYIQLAQQELGINTADVNLTDPKWMNLLNQVDPKTGQRVSMSLDEALATFRSDPRYGYDTTGQARQSATQLAQALQQRMGTAA